MSGRKKLRRAVIDDMFAGKISVPEARARMAWIKSGAWRPPGRAMAVKSAAAVTGFERYDAHPDPQVREWAGEAARRQMVTKGAVSRETPPRRPSGTTRALAWAPGPDGRMGWQVPQATGPYGVRIAPDGTAGR